MSTLAIPTQKRRVEPVTFGFKDIILWILGVKIINDIFWISFEKCVHFKLEYVPIGKKYGIRYMCFKWLVFLISHLDLTGMWFGEDQRGNIIKTHV